MLSERSQALREAFPDCKELTPAQVAACAYFAREHVVQLCIADPLPMQARLRGKQVFIRCKDLGDFFDQEIAEIQVAQTQAAAMAAASLQQTSLSRREVVESLFRAELRFALFSAESMHAFSKLVDSIGTTDTAQGGGSAFPVDERCQEFLDMERIVLTAEVRSMHVGLSNLLIDMAPLLSEQPSKRQNRPE